MKAREPGVPGEWFLSAVESREVGEIIGDCAFEAYDLHRVVAYVNPENKPSWALLDRLGFRREGHTIQNYWFQDKWNDEYLYAVLKDEWLGKVRN